MNAIMLIDFYTEKWNNADKALLEKNKQERIDRDDIYSEWHRRVSLLTYFLLGTSLQSLGASTDVSEAEMSSIYKEECFLPSKRDFFPCYIYKNNRYCLATLFENEESNLDLWTIRLSGNDDCSFSFDILGKEDAYEEWGRLLAEDFITDDNIKHFYFSN